MQVQVESVGNLERRMTLRLPAQDLETKVGGRLREMARTARIKGFRPGKVPTKVVEQRYGQQVRAEVLDGMLREGFDSAIRENELAHGRQPADPASDAASDGDLAYVATFEVMPEFGDIDVEKLRSRAPHRRNQRRRHRPHDREPAPAAPQLDRVVTRPAQQGDAVDVETLVAGRRRAPAGRRHRKGRRGDRFGRDAGGDRSRRWSA